MKYQSIINLTDSLDKNSLSNFTSNIFHINCTVACD